MIPVTLTLKGFLSYREPVSVDFTGFDMACVIGHNGAGKSSLLDAMTWALFGKARSSDDELINMQEVSTEVTFLFDYENQRYEVSRTKKRGSSKVMNLQMLNEETGKWISLSEATLSATQEKLERILKMDYDTFINASFFLQGQADQFAQQRPADRKITLAKILELDVWEIYQERAALQRKNRQTRLDVVDQVLQSVYADLSREEELKARLAALEDKLKQSEEIAEMQETVVQTMRRQREQAEHQQEQIRVLKLAAENAQNRLSSHRTSLALNIKERQGYEGLLSQEKEILEAVEQWKKAQADLEKYDELAKSFNDSMIRRAEPLQKIREEEIHLNNELTRLEEKHQEFLENQENLKLIQKKLAETYQEQKTVTEKVSQYPILEETRDHLISLNNAIEVERLGIHREMQQLSDRISKLENIETVFCPVCGQTLEEEHRKTLIDELRLQGRRLKVSWDKLGEDFEDYDVEIKRLLGEIQQLRKLESEKLVRVINPAIASLTDNEKKLSENIKTWQSSGAESYAALREKIANEQFALDTRLELQEIDDQLRLLGYDSQVHERLRAEELAGRESQERYQSIEKAKSALAPLQRIIVEQESLQIELEQEAENASAIAQTAADQLSELMVDEEVFREARNKWSEVRDLVNTTRQELGGAQQSIASMDDQRVRQQDYELEKEDLAKQIDRYKLLEEAFSQNGIPALLIEQAIPEIEEQANEILSQLSTTGMMVQFRTQRAYKDKKRKDKRETLDIIISDNAGERNYEMYSGGEAFRVNFAIRLALSKMLAGRAGARLQTLVIDEGFGSQDTEGVIRLIEAINLIKSDFAKILVITHMDAIKDSFPAQIEVFKTTTGSKVEVLS